MSAPRTTPAGRTTPTATRENAAPPLPSAPSTATSTIGLGTHLLYSLPSAGAMYIYTLVLIVFMNFATDVLGMAPGIVGTIIFAAKIWDAVSDPAIGYLSDRTASRFGRRKTWMTASAIPFVIMTVMLWSPPASLSDTALIAWVAVAIFGFYTVFTAYSVPQMALGAELSSLPIDRSRLFGGRQFSSSVGLLLAFALAAPLLENPADARETAARYATIGAVATAILILVCTWALPPERPDYRGRGATKPLSAVRDVWRNPHARLLLFVYFIEVLGIGGTSAMAVYVVKYVIKETAALPIVFLAFAGATMCSIPIWIALGRRFERHRVWLCSMGISCIGYGMMALQAEGRVDLMVAVTLITGFSSGCGATLGQAIKADIIDYDEYMTGERKEGTYYAAWNLAMKLGTGIMMAFAGWALQAAGFQENVEQTQLVKWTMLFIMGGAPFISLLIGMTVFRHFSLTSREHARIRAELDLRAAAKRQTSAA